MGKMKELYTIGQDMQRLMASRQLFAPSFEELSEMQRQYLGIVRGCQRQPREIKPTEKQTQLCDEPRIGNFCPCCGDLIAEGHQCG